METGLYIFALSGLFNAGISLLYASYVMLKSMRDFVVRLYFIMSISIAVWGLGYWQWLLSDNAAEAIFWLKFLTVGSFLIPVFFFHWIVTLLELKDFIYRFIFIFIYMTGVLSVLAVIFQTNLVIQDVVTKGIFPYWPDAGVLYGPIVFILYFLVVTFALVLIYRALRRDLAEDQQMLHYFLIVGSIIGFLGGATNFPLWYNVSIPPYGNFLVALFPIIFGYASFRHRLFNIRLVFAEILVLTIVGIMFFELVLSEGKIEFITRIFLLILVSVLAYLVIRNTYQEINSREKGERLARYLANANARLRELDKQKTEFVSIASHQLRSPIAAIKGYASLIVDGTFGRVPEKFEEPLHRILESGQRIGIMVDDFLNVTRIEQGRMSYDMKPHNICDILKSVVDELKVVVEEKGLQINLDFDESKKFFVNADEGKLKQIFSNLIDNAIKYTPQGSIQVSVSGLELEKKVLVKIKDTGIGIAREEIQNLFQKFNRASNANEENVLGTGLGLYIAREILKAHQGWVGVESDGVGKGSTFTVELPACEEPQDPVQENENNSQ